MIYAHTFASVVSLNTWAGPWLHAMGAVLWQSTLLIAAAAAVAWCLRRSSPTMRFWLWQIVAIKLLLMPFWSSSISLPSWAGQAAPLVAIEQVKMPREKPEKAASTPAALAGESAAAGVAARSTLLWRSLAAVTWQGWLLAVWCAAVCWQLFRLLVQRLRLGQLLRRGVPVCVGWARPTAESASGGKNGGQCPPYDSLAQLVAELAGEIGLRRAPAVVAVAEDCPLFVCGLWCPTIILPERLAAALGPDERRQVILHELAHVKRRDLFWGWPVEIARIAYFFHPLVYWVAHQLRLERELACDQLAMVRSGHPPAEYARTLVRVVSQASVPAAAQAAAIAAGLSGGAEQRRGS
jgi:Zn-dependent protease with chaperone function